MVEPVEQRALPIDATTVVRERLVFEFLELHGGIDAKLARVLANFVG